MEKEKDIIEIIVDESTDFSDNILSGDTLEIITDDEPEIVSNESLKERIKLFFENLPNDLSPLYIKISCTVCAIALLLSFGIGIILPKNDSSVEKQLAILHETDSTYISAKTDYDSLSKEIAGQQENLTKKQQELDEFTNSQNGLDKVLQDNERLEKENETLKNEVNKKQSTLDGLNATAEEKKNTTVTLSSGKYTVGEKIAAGTYTVVGTGNIVISADGKSRVNTTLTSNGKSYSISSGDVIKISGNAKFIPE